MLRQIIVKKNKKQTIETCIELINSRNKKKHYNCYQLKKV